MGKKTYVNDSSFRATAEAIREHFSKFGRLHRCCSDFIRTGGLKHINPFGQETFQKNLLLLDNKFFGNLVFSREHAFEIAS